MTIYEKYYDKYKHPDWETTTLNEFLLLFAFSFLFAHLLLPGIWSAGAFINAALFFLFWFWNAFITDKNV